MSCPDARDGLGYSAADYAELAARSRAEQGLPPVVIDRSALCQVSRSLARDLPRVSAAS